MIKIGVVGVGKMGISHLAIVNSHPQVTAVICDASKLILDGIKKFTDLETWRDYDAMLEKAELDGVIIATPTRTHAAMVRKALERGLHVFCEKPFCLDWRESDELARLAEERGLVNQVGYHYRYVGTFQEVKRLVAAGAIGKVTHVLAEAYGPVVLKPKGSTWRTISAEGGGCLYDYASHSINLVNWYFGTPTRVAGTVLNSIFSAGSDDEVYSTFSYPCGLSVQLSVNWSDESCRKMSSKVTLTGTNGRIQADRQEVQAYLRKSCPELGYDKGWNVKYTTELTKSVRFYLRGEEYSAQVDHFLDAVAGGTVCSPNGFAGAAETDRTIALMLADRAGERAEPSPAEVVQQTPRRGWFGLGSVRGRAV
jgi:predicted dehydrogenase